MATVAEWIEGARPRTLPNAVAPVLVGAGAARAVGGFVWWQSLLALTVALALTVGVNFANDYSDGVRGTDEARVGPLRLVGSGVAAPGLVRTVAFAAFGLAGLAGLVLVLVTGHFWLLAVGAACVGAAWFYTGGRRPYGYAGLGELAVFLFFGLVAVLGTLYVQAGQVTGVAAAAAAAVGAFSAGVLVANNLRDIPSDVQAGKRTLAVRLGDRRTRHLWCALIAAPFVVSVLLTVSSPLVLLGFLAAPLAFVATRRVVGGSTGLALVPVLRDTALAMLVWSAGTGLAFALG